MKFAGFRKRSHLAWTADYARGDREAIGRFTNESERHSER
jgi:hypothetical protein